MMRTLFLFVCALCVASCFVQPGQPLRAPVQKVPMARATAPDMMIQETEAAVTTVAAAASTLLASNAGDFGGYTIPIIGLALLGATIGILAGPVED